MNNFLDEMWNWDSYKTKYEDYSWKYFFIDLINWNWLPYNLFYRNDMYLNLHEKYYTRIGKWFNKRSPFVNVLFKSLYYILTWPLCIFVGVVVRLYVVLRWFFFRDWASKINDTR